MSKKHPTAAEVKAIHEQMEADIREKFSLDLPPDQVQPAIDELNERLPTLFYTAFKLGIPSGCCDNAMEVLILDILRARLGITIPKASELDISGVVSFVLNREKL